MTAHRRQARDEAIRAVLPVVGEHGWTIQAMQHTTAGNSDLLFPGGPSDMVAAYIDLVDREMVAQAGPVIADQKLSRRVRTLVATRLEQALPHKQAVRRAMAVLAIPANAPVAVRCTYGTVDAIWRAAGDVSTDFSWYSKRTLLAWVYGSTLMYWLDTGREHGEALAFLDRRLADVARLGKLRRSMTERFRS